MSGDISDTLPLPDNAGIIPRVLHALFAKLEGAGSDAAAENSVKISFIELYNEELRDLLSADDSVKLRMGEENRQSKGGAHSSATVVQGMEEAHIQTASKGLQLLRSGSHKRQVAATKCNDLSSRSHTVFTITVYMKRTSDTGEDYISAGKLNLVDLAGSENIKRSGAENKNAVEAGLINKSLLTLGRVINALVDKKSHIPYRESKLTRLLQDSLGGRTKTCIIATLSPAKSNLEETISTLDYAFRAKNIKNKPQVNATVTKKTLLREFTSEIEKLKGELVATRQRNGVYLTQESYDEMVTESESRRILSQEMRDKVEAMEVNLRNKVQELFQLTTRFMGLKKESDTTRAMLEGTKSILEKTESVLAHTKTALKEEEMLRAAHERTEERLFDIGHGLIETIGSAQHDVTGLNAKLRRRSALHANNRQQWGATQVQVSEATKLVEERVYQFQTEQYSLIGKLSERMDAFVNDELQKLETTQAFLQEKSAAFEWSRNEVNDQNAKSRDALNSVLEEIKSLREDVKQKVGAGLNELSAAAKRISEGIMMEVDAFQTQLHTSYASLGRDFKSTFDDLVRELNEQREESQNVQQAIMKANGILSAQNEQLRARLTTVLEEEKKAAAVERQALLVQIAALVNGTAQAHDARLEKSINSVGHDLAQFQQHHDKLNEAFGSDSAGLTEKSQALTDKVIKSRESIKTKIKADFAGANERTTALRNVTTSVYDSTTRVVSEQVQHLDTQLLALNDIVARVRQQNNEHHEAHVDSLSGLASTVQTSYTNIGEHFIDSYSRIQALGSEMSTHTNHVRNALPLLSAESSIRQPLRTLRDEISAQVLQEYTITGQTPHRSSYDFPHALPRTDNHERLLAKMRGQSQASPVRQSSPSKLQRSPNKGLVFTDLPTPDESEEPFSDPAKPPSSLSRPTSSNSTESTSASGLRELDINTIAALPTSFDGGEGVEREGSGMPPLKRLNTTGSGAESRLPKKRNARMTVAAVREERENVALGALSASVGPLVGHPGGRVLRSGRGS